ncbi:MAG: hypothetical protein PQJ61_10700 [Spirochaetales bacterium]|uniref:Uncharacterized protein n=1 Tax=Candidatus Thalassospirochaeta sargassi TaxID=3119039 RepID=A0AAJ1IDH0_9SPIO|nr:hypothetical protein [Spirochaetales bacterium]
MKYWFADGKITLSDTLGGRGGFLVIYGDIARCSLNNSAGHDDLLRGIAVAGRLNKTEVLGNGIRLFFKYVEDGVVISGVRAIDNERIAAEPAHYAKIIRRVLK